MAAFAASALDQAMGDGPHVHRDRWGRPVILTGAQNPSGSMRKVTCKGCNKSIEGTAYRRATTFIDVLDDRTLLEKWKMRGVARGLADRQGLLYAVAAAGEDNKKVDSICEDALQAAGTSDAATRGTALHTFTEQYDRGQAPKVPEAARPDMDAYARTMRAAGLRMLDIETFVVDDQLEVAGTFDRLLELDGVRYIGDIKTGSIDFGLRKIAMQLAVYSGGQRYDPATGTRSPLEADPDYGLVIHLPAGEARCELVWLDLVEARSALALAAQVWAWRKADGDGLRIAGGPPALGSHIQMVGDVDALTGLWEANARRWNSTLTELARRRRAELEVAS